MKTETKIPMNLQFFADGGESGGEASTESTTVTPAPINANVDYDKLVSILDSKLDVTSKGVMKSYFKEQGLSEEEAQAAIKAFKDSRESETQKQMSDYENLKKKIEEYESKEKQEKLTSEVKKVADLLEVDEKSFTPIMKLADLSNVTNADGTINTDEVKKALSKVLEEVPAFKKSAVGFQKVGATEQNTVNNKSIQNEGLKKPWNRFN